MYAVRTHKGKAATVTLYADDGTELGKAGGARADRAAAVLAVQWTAGEDDTPGIYGLRGSFPAAQAEANRLASARTMRHAGHTFARTPAHIAVAVPVLDPKD